jgi:hypothetical protein
LGVRGSTKVSAPGQKALASRRARPSSSTSSSSWAMSAIWLISGLKSGRPLAANIFATADALVASAASP